MTKLKLTRDDPIQDDTEDFSLKRFEDLHQSTLALLLQGRHRFDPDG
jgi:hypothetical protein